MEIVDRAIGKILEKNLKNSNIAFDHDLGFEIKPTKHHQICAFCGGELAKGELRGWTISGAFYTSGPMNYTYHCYHAECLVAEVLNQYLREVKNAKLV